MSQLAEHVGWTETAAMFSELAASLQSDIYKHYDSNTRDGAGGFYSQYNGQLQYKETVGNLMSWLLDDLPDYMARSNLRLMDDGFDAPYVVPCIATFDTANFDPYSEEKNSHWRNGAVWVVANNFLAENGLAKHIKRLQELPEDLRNKTASWRDRIHESNRAVTLLNSAYAENHNPLTGEGHRLDRTGNHVFGIPVLVSD